MFVEGFLGPLVAVDLIPGFALSTREQPSLTVDNSVWSLAWACSMALRRQLRFVRELMPKSPLGS
jgi:hypothetical protein